MVIIKYRSIFLSIAALMVLVSWGAIAYYGLNLGNDFTGGAILELEYPAARPNLEIVQAELVKLGRSDVLVQPIGEKGYLFRAKELSDTDRTALTGNSTVIKRFDAIGPTIGRELANKALIAIALVLLLIIAYIALAHDISIPTGLFAYLGYARGTEINALFLTALLAILGLSVSDTIVVFDRVRENLQRRAANTFVDTVGLSLNQVFTRSINISLTTLIALSSVYLFGGESTRDFALTLIVGMTAGIYSSIFIASPLLILFSGEGKKNK